MSLSLGQTRERQPGGLTEAEAAARQAQGQGNDVKLRTSRTYAEIVRENLFTFFNIVLFSLALLLFLLGSPKDAFFTGVVALFNVVVATIQELRAKRKLDRIALLAQPTATVIREGQEKVIDPGEAVLGDLLVAEAGDQIIVDGLVLSNNHLLLGCYQRRGLCPTGFDLHRDRDGLDPRGLRRAALWILGGR